MKTLSPDDHARMRRNLIELRLECGETDLYRDFSNALDALDAALAYIAKLELTLHPKKGKKLVFGEECNVLLTQGEYGRLCQSYGKDRADRAIAFLDLHIGAKGRDTYKNHSLALRKWVFDALDERDARAARMRGDTQNNRNMEACRDWLGDERHSR